MDHAIAASCGRMAFYYILRALNLPAGSEIIFPALTFGLCRRSPGEAGFKPVFVDVDPFTFNLEPKHIATAITEHTRVIVPTHLYGQPCAMKEILRIAEKAQPDRRGGLRTGRRCTLSRPFSWYVWYGVFL